MMLMMERFARCFPLLILLRRETSYLPPFRCAFQHSDNGIIEFMSAIAYGTRIKLLTSDSKVGCQRHFTKLGRVPHYSSKGCGLALMFLRRQKTNTLE